MIYELPQLPYGYDALEPFIDKQTMQIHHGKHHATYVAKLNEALAKHPEVAEQPLENLLRNLNNVPEEIRTAVRNHGGGHYNHSLFWRMMAPAVDFGTPEGRLLEAITNTFGSLEKLQEAFGEAAGKVFGSGWTWLVTDPAGTSGRLAIVTTPNQDTPLALGNKPVLGLDVWEHAYYIHYQNRRPDYVKAWWNIVNWKEVERRFEGQE